MAKYWEQHEHMHNLFLHSINEVSGIQQKEFFDKENSKHDEPQNKTILV